MADPPINRAQSRRNPHLRLACRRCQKRKIKCDCEYPTCRNCRKSQAVCVDGESTRLQNAPEDGVGDARNEDRNVAALETSALHARIADLESLIRSRLPDVDLAGLPPWGDRSMDGDGDEEARIGNDTGNLANNDVLSHEIGLVSVGASADPRYIGPSSGVFLGRMLLPPRLRHNANRENDPTIANESRPAHMISELMETVRVPLPLPSREHAETISRVYFDVIHGQYPILHRPNFMNSLQQMHASPESTGPEVAFQVFMVLAIGSTILSRRCKSHLPADSYCLAALQYFDKLNVENSISGLQCLLLLMVFVMHSPQMKLNIWYLNYHCIAAMIDLGLQRNIDTVALFEREMRTRLFWVVFTLDRTLATMMGRPIGIRDEACELRWPRDLEDSALSSVTSTATRNGPDSPSHMTWSIRLFQLAKINSEIKYVANSISRDQPCSPGYAQPGVSNIHAWQLDVLQRLDKWADDLPASGAHDANMRIICQIRYHALRMLLLRNSPAIPQPSAESLKLCYDSACRSICLYEEMYRQDLLVYSWMTFHGLIVSTVTMVYCVRAIPDFLLTVDLDAMTNNFGASLCILSATGEHWAGAKRSRDVLYDLSTAVIRMAQNARSARTTERFSRNQTSLSTHPEGSSTVLATYATPAQTTMRVSDNMYAPATDTTFSDPLDFAMLDATWPLPFADLFGTEHSNPELLIRNLFEDFIHQPI